MPGSLVGGTGARLFFGKQPVSDAKVEATIRLLPALDVPTVAILLVLGFELAGGLLYGFVCVLLFDRHERTSRTPDPNGGVRVLPLPGSHAPDARKAA